MQELSEVILTPRGGLNTDDSLITPPLGAEGRSLFELGDYSFMRNLNSGSSIDNNTGATETIPGTTQVTTYKTWNGSAWAISSYPSTGTCRGKLKDIKSGRVFIFWVNPDRIEMYVKSERATYELLSWSGLNFDLTKTISAALIGHFLLFTDELENAPRIVDVDDIHNLKFTLGGNFSEFHISLAKWAPLAPPVPSFVQKGVLEDVNQYLEKGLFQFAYRYIFKGGFRSTYSPPSHWVSNEYKNGSIGSITVAFPGFTYDFNTPANTAFGHSDVRFYEFVDFIEIVYRESSRDGWKLWGKIDSNNASASFTNTGPARRIATRDITQYFDSVPLKSMAIGAIDNRPMLAGNMDDLPAIEDFSVEQVQVHSGTVSVLLRDWLGPATNFTSLSSHQKGILNNILALRQHTFKERGIYKLGIIGQHHTGRISLVTTTDNWIYNIPAIDPALINSVFEQLHALGFKIPDSVTPPEEWVSYQIVRSECLNIERFMYGVADDFKFLRNDPNGMTDEISTDEDTKVLMKDFFNNPNIGTDNELQTLPLYKRLLSNIRKNKTSGETISTCSRIYIDISNWYLTPTKFPTTEDHPSNNLFWEYRNGDRIRFVGSRSATWDTDQLDVFDEEIIEFTGNGIIVNKPDGLRYLPDRASVEQPANGKPYVIEIYRPKKFNTEEILFYEMGEWYPIKQPGTVNRAFSKKDFVWTGEANVTYESVAGHNIFHKMPIANGDCHAIKKSYYYNGISNTQRGFYPESTVDNPSGLAVLPSMTQDIKRTWDAWEKNNGRSFPAYEYPPIEFFKSTQVRFGGKFLEDSLFVDINRFRDENQKIYPEEYGTIRALVNVSNAQVESVGAILLAIGEVETWSIYVNRTTFEDLSGKTTVALSDKVLGSFNTLLGSHGTKHPESISIERGRVLYWDNNAGSWIRYAQDGLTEISIKYKMKNWFKEMASLISSIEASSETPVKIISTWDNYHERWITYMSHPDFPSTFKGYEVYKCLSFHEDTPVGPRWKEFFDYAAEAFDSIDNEVYSIITGKIHIHEDDENNFSTFYGVKKDCEIELIANPQSRKKKVWQSQGHIASDRWSFPFLKGDWRSNSRPVQETSIALSVLSEKEEMFWADIPRDINTPNRTESDAKVNGDVIRAKALRVRLKLDPAVTYLSVFNWLALYYTLSEKTTKT